MVAERRGFDLCVSFSCYDYISITINCINYEQRCVFSIKDYVWVMPHLFAYRNRIIYPDDRGGSGTCNPGLNNSCL